MAAFVNFLFLALMGSTWGLHFVLVKKIANHGVPGHMVLFPTLLGVTFVFLLLMILKQSQWKMDKRWWIFLGVCSILGYAFPIWLEIVVSPYIDSTLLTLITTSTPVWCILFGFLLRLTKVSKWHLICVSLGIVAAASLLMPGTALPESSSRLWFIAAIGVPTSYAMYNLYVSTAWPQGLSIYIMAAYESFFAAVLALPLFIFSGVQSGFQGIFEYKSTILLLVLVTAIEVWAFFELVRRAGAVYVSFASFVALVSGVCWSGLLLKEEITPWMVVSIGMIIVSLIFCLIGDKRQASIA